MNLINLWLVKTEFKVESNCHRSTALKQLVDVFGKNLTRAEKAIFDR